MKIQSIFLSTLLTIGIVTPHIYASQSIRRKVTASLKTMGNWAWKNPKKTIASGALMTANAAYIHNLQKKSHLLQDELNYQTFRAESNEELLTPIKKLQAQLLVQQQEERFQELVLIFNQMQVDLGIHSLIPLKIDYSRRLFGSAEYEFNKHSQCVIISHLSMYHPAPIIKNMLRHELEHHLQYLKNPEEMLDVCKKDLLEDPRRIKLEHEADSAAANNILCLPCLLMVQKHAALISLEQQKAGYFVPADYDPYIAKAQRNPQWCQAHKANEGKIEEYDPKEIKIKSMQQDLISKMVASYKPEVQGPRLSHYFQTDQKTK